MAAVRTLGRRFHLQRAQLGCNPLRPSPAARSQCSVLGCPAWTRPLEFRLPAWTRPLALRWCVWTCPRASRPVGRQALKIPGVGVGVAGKNLCACAAPPPRPDPVQNIGGGARGRLRLLLYRFWRACVLLVVTARVYCSALKDTSK